MQDQLFLKDYKKTIEIGAFAEERQTTQTILVNICVDLSHQSPVDDEAVDEIFSYDVLVDAIEANLSERRYNLLEVLAEDIANYILAKQRAVKVEVEIQKLDRIDGALGIRIKRTGNDNMHTQADAVNTHELCVVALKDLQIIKPSSSPATVYLPMLSFEPAESITDQHLIALKLDYQAWLLAQHLGLPVIDTQTETEALMARGDSFVRAFGKQVFAASPPIETFDQPSLIGWAKRIIRPVQTHIIE